MARGQVFCACGHGIPMPPGGDVRETVCPQCGANVRMDTAHGASECERSANGSEGPQSPGSRKRVGEILLEQGVITQRQLDDALAIQRKQGGKTVEILVSMGHIDVDAFVKAMAVERGAASLHLADYCVPGDWLDLIPKDVARRLEVFPIDKTESMLTLSAVAPLDPLVVRALEGATGLVLRVLLCQPEIVRRAIATHYAGPETEDSEAGDGGGLDPLRIVGSTLEVERLAGLVRRVRMLPPLPDTVQRVRAAMDDPDKSVNDVAEIVSSDPAVAAKLLSLANSAAYGLANAVTSIAMATSLLGMRETFTMVLSSAASEFFGKVPWIDPKRFWEESTYCASAAKTIAGMCAEHQTSAVFSAGLLHNIGELVLAQIAPERCRRVEPGLPCEQQIEAEMEVFGMPHMEAGYLLAAAWKLPDEIALPIRFHHTPSLADRERDAVAIVSIAAALAEQHMGGGRDAVVFHRCMGALETLGLDLEALDTVRRKARAGDGGADS